ncbi:MAG: Oxygen-independent coproporphyrinogen-III oxidase [Chlamydiae bacterium]|nr:Oxygen-independent coproporphyrinogen-III oxidase [Chlamydiota bacterium]
MYTITPELVLKFHKPAPRYTSYPTAPEWGPMDEQVYRKELEKLAKTENPLSLYFHIPFCKTMCLYCGCSVVLNRKPENETLYVDYLTKEIDLVTKILGRKVVPQLHFGGGTPTKLSIPLFQRLFTHIQERFSLDFSKEIAIEIDPRTVLENGGEKLRFLHQIGFNRVSFGVQDTDPKVQEAVKRRQSLEMTQETYWLARELGFSGVNLDLIYGLPYQTPETFSKTISDILEMRPDRIALFSYAKVPWLKPHQKAIKDKTLPSTEEKFRIYTEARSRLVDAGYVVIGMDHFALEEDVMAVAYREKTLQRNFQGYTVRHAEDMVSFGASSIGFVQNGYFQNLKALPDYYGALEKGELPICKGRILTEEDRLRKWVIHTLMCTFSLDKKSFEKKVGVPFDSYFADAEEKLAELEAEGLILQTPEKIEVTQPGELLIRNVVMTFDAYLKQESKPKFSQSI